MLQDLVLKYGSKIWNLLLKRKIFICSLYHIEVATKWVPIWWHFQKHFFNENIWVSIKISQNFVPKGPINNIPSLVQKVVWCRPGDKPLSEPIMVRLPMHICVTWPQWVILMSFRKRYQAITLCIEATAENLEFMMTSSKGNIFRVTGHLCGEFTGPQWIPRTKASDAELWCFLWSAPE